MRNQNKVYQPVYKSKIQRLKKDNSFQLQGKSDLENLHCLCVFFKKWKTLKENLDVMEQYLMFNSNHLFVQIQLKITLFLVKNLMRKDTMI